MTGYVELRPSWSQESLDRYSLAPAVVDREKHLSNSNSSRNDHLVLWASMATLCSAVLTCVLFMASLWRGFPTQGESQYVNIPLRRPSTYINLDKVSMKSNCTFPPIINFPQVVYQINTADPGREMSEDDRSWRADIGTIYPDSRHIYITYKTSTIIQFRHLDYGMERCSLKASVPRKSNAFDPATNVLESSVFDVWLLDTTTEISRHIGDSWKHAPRRREKLATLSFPELSEQDEPGYLFECPSNQFSTFELACSPESRECSIDFWQDQRDGPLAGIYLMQYQLLLGVEAHMNLH